MVPYDEYKDLLGRPYEDGQNDCYGLGRDYFASVYDLLLPDYARSASFFEEGIDLITPFLREEGFVIVDVPVAKLQKGDALMLCVKRDWMKQRTTNHIGVYVGNGMFIHHMFNDISREDAMTVRWAQRIMGVVRHPDVTDMNRAKMERVNLKDVLPEHIQRRYGLDKE